MARAKWRSAEKSARFKHSQEQSSLTDTFLRTLDECDHLLRDIDTRPGDQLSSSMKAFQLAVEIMVPAVAQMESRLVPHGILTARPSPATVEPDCAQPSN